MRTKYIGWLIVAVVAIGAAFWYRQNVFRPPAPRTMGRVIVITGGPGPYWETVAQGARAAARDLNVELSVESPAVDENVEQQSEILSNLDLQGVAGVALSPLDAAGQSSLIDKIAEKAVVVTFDSDAPESNRDTYIGTSNYAAGQRAAELVKEAVPDGGKVLVLLANLTKNNMVERRDGFEVAIAQGPSAEAPTDDRYQIVDCLADEGSEQRCRELVRQALQENNDLACIVGMNGYHGPLLGDLIGETNHGGEIKLVVFDDEPKTLDGIEAGDIYATVAQDPYLYGYRAVERLATICRGNEGLRPLSKAKSTFSVNTQIIRKDGVADYREQVKQRLAKTPAA